MMKKRTTHVRRRFVASVPDRAGYATFTMQEDGRVHTCRPLTSLETFDLDRERMTLQEQPMGITLPSPACLDDSVLALVCPKCLAVWYLSRDFYRYLKQTERNTNALTPGLFSWRFDLPEHVPCKIAVRMISLTDDIPNSFD